MIPPKCCVCGEKKDCTLIYFSKCPTDNEWDKWQETSMIPATPPYVDWFCKEHVTRANELCHLTIDVAKATMLGPTMEKLIK